MAATTAIQIDVTKVMEPPPAFGPQYDEFTRPGHATTRFSYQGQRGERKPLTVVFFSADAETAAAKIRALAALQGNVIRLVGELNARTYIGFFHRFREVEGCQVESTDPTATWMNRLEFDFTATESA